MSPTSLFAGFLINIGTTFGNLSDAPLEFKELLCTQSFKTLDNLVWVVVKNYMNQGIMQFYKIIGAADVIGNPIGLVDKVGRGVIEFFNAPARGLLKGPKEFAGGVSKGVKSLVSGVVGGSMDSLSKATGSLYGVVKSVGGDPDGQEKLAKPNNVFSGIVHGIKGGTSEIVGGITGIFTKPYKGAKKEGVKGFFKGVGKGLAGAITSPFSAVLRTGNNITAGISASATNLGKGNLTKQGRFRLPRYFGPKMILEEYDPDLAEAYECLYVIEEGKYHKERMIMYFDLESRLIGKRKQQIVIFTEKRIFLIQDFKFIVQVISYKRIGQITLHMRTQNEFYLILYDRKNEMDVVILSTYGNLAGIYEYLNTLPQVNVVHRSIKKRQIQTVTTRTCVAKCTE